MNNFLERQQQGLGGPKPKGWTVSTTSRSMRSGAPAALPSGGGLPVFEKRVQLKESLPSQARGNPRLSPQGPGIVGASSENPPPPRTSLKAPTFMPPNPVREHIPHHGPGWVGSPNEPITPASQSRSPASGWSRPQQTGDSPEAAAAASLERTLANGGLGSPSLAPQGMGASTRSMSVPPTSQRTSSPSGRMHPNPVRRAELRKADMFHNIDYYGGIGAPDNDRLVKEASWLSTQSWFESLRYYPKGEDADDDEAAYSGLTHGMAAPTEHLETDVRTRLGIAKADADWVPDQLQMQWLPESPALLKRLKKSYLNLRR
jgi:hypothetical protein